MSLISFKIKQVKKQTLSQRLEQLSHYSNIELFLVWRKSSRIHSQKIFYIPLSIYCMTVCISFSCEILSFVTITKNEKRKTHRIHTPNWPKSRKFDHFPKKNVLFCFKFRTCHYCVTFGIICGIFSKLLQRHRRYCF